MRDPFKPKNVKQALENMETMKRLYEDPISSESAKHHCRNSYVSSRLMVIKEKGEEAVKDFSKNLDY